MTWTETCGTPAAYERATIVAHTAIAENSRKNSNRE